MTLPSGIGWGVDVYRAVFYPINTAGGIDAPGYPVAAETPYEGLEFSRPKSLTLNLGAPRAITNVAQGRVQDTIYLPSTDAKTAEFHLSNIDLVTFAQLSNVSSRTLGGGRMMPFGTDKQGLEIAGIFLISQLAFHDDDGVSQWHNYILPRTRAVVNMPNFDENAIDVTVNMSLSPSKKHVWGEAVSTANDGALEITGLDHVTWNRFNIVAWLADGVEDVFLFPTSKPAVSDYATSFTLWDYNAGTEVTAGITKATTGVTYAVAPAANKLLIALYEY
jgi:hypothetical protein